ncbi:hypothetical protein C8R46DRAFT_1106714 [Mycena filopes]|nr:hypothetical protein C8R46DRAFT_1106714 [Mycena filopes]
MATELTRLPLELLDNIASQAAQSDLLALCRTNNGLYDICLRWIYQRLSPSTLALAVTLLKSLASNKKAAGCVRFIAVHLPLDKTLQSFARLMRNAFLNLTSLQQLQFSSSTPFHLFSGIHFPRLTECLIPFCAHTAAFIRMHPTIVELAIMPEYGDAVSIPVQPTFSHMSLPALKSFSGSASLACEVIPLAPVTLVTISWEVRLDSEYHRHLPHLAVLGFRDISFLPPVEGALEAFYSTVESHISAFSDLTSLAVVSHFQHTAPSPADLAVEFDFVRRCGARARTLSACTLASETIWLRTTPGEAVWFPFPREAEPEGSESWRYKWLVTTVILAPTVYPAYMEALEGFSGKDGLEALKAAILSGDDI